MFRKQSRSEDRSRKNIVKCRKLNEIILPNSKLRFNAEQLQNLNFLFNKKLQERPSSCEQSVLLAKSVTERLIQRLLSCAGSLDPRFASKFLITNNEISNDEDHHSKRLTYLARLDNLSTPTLYQSDNLPKLNVTESDADCPPAYARVRLHASSFKEWGEFLNASGYLRRDKIQTRLVELLAEAAGRDTPNSPLHVDESIVCGIPGKIVSPVTLHHLLRIPSTEQLFYGPGGNMPRFPDPRDFRLAIVDEPGGIRLKVEFLSPALSNICIHVRILVAIGIDAWPSTPDFPSRIPLGHTDCLLYHQAAETGMYLVGYGVQSSAWQMRVPAAECTILNHFSSSSTVGTIRDILFHSIGEIEISRNLKKHQVSYKILNKYILLTVLFQELEENSSKPFSDLITWSPLYLSTLVLKILDNLVSSLHCQFQPNYFFKKSNLMVNPGHLCEDDYTIEANNIKLYLLRLFDESLTSTKDNEAFIRMLSAQDGEMNLLYKWKELINGLLPPPGTRGRRFCFAGSRNSQEIAHTQYTARQLEYIGMLLKSMLTVKQRALQTDFSPMGQSTKKDENPEQEHALEDLIYLIVSIMDQARDQYLKTTTNNVQIKNKSKIKSQYNCYTSKLVEIIRKEKEPTCLDLYDDLVLVKTILKWVYRAMDQNKRYLAPILRPFLSNLFSTSHAISWHLESIKKRSNHEEIQSQGHFAKLVNLGEISPAQGLIDGVNKNWTWAKNMLSMVEKRTLRIVFVSERNKVYRHILSLPSYQMKDNDDGKQFEQSGDVKKRETLPSRSYFSTIKRKASENYMDVNTSQYELLKYYSPLTLAVEDFYRRGEHRDCGDIFKSLISMQRLNLFQEVTASLPKEERSEILEVIHNIQTTKTRRACSRKWSSTLPQLQRRPLSTGSECFQKYTPKEESAGIRVIENEEVKAIGASVRTEANTLIKNCRAVRLQEDSNIIIFQDNLQIKALLRKSESFKY